jgi:predicted TIM-barrel fold metal-dependent hydrolase
MDERDLRGDDLVPAEKPLDADLPICDAHHHLWQRPPKDYLLNELLEDLRSGHRIVSTVAIECGYGYRLDGADEFKPLGETEFLEGIAARVANDSSLTIRIAAAIVGHANLALGDAIAPVLEAHLAISPKRFRGIRHSATWDGSGAVRHEAARGMLTDGQFRAGFAWLGKLGLSFEAWVYHPQLSEIADLARAFPNVPIILNHIGAPLGVGPYAGKRDEVFRHWRRGIAGAAQAPNVLVKLGGVGSFRSGYDWHERAVKPSSFELAQALRPYIEHCIDSFGIERCLFESNFPVEKASNTYVNLWNAFKRITEKYSIDERAALFHDNAVRVYRIDGGSQVRIP